MWIPDFILKFFGRKVADKLDLQEDSKMDTKKWYQSKTIWTSVVGALIGIYAAVSAVHPLPPIPEWVYTILASIGLYSLRTGETKIQ